jgi:hypothetical protein
MPRRRALLAACLAAAIMAAGCDLVGQQPRPAATPTNAAGPVVPRVSPKPSPLPKAADKAIAAFIARVQAGNLSYRATFKGQVRSTASILSTKGSLAVSGRNYGLVVDFTFPGQGLGRVEHRYVGGKAWLREGKQRWARFTGFLAEMSMSPLAAVVDESDVTLLQTIPARGGAPERYRIKVPTGFFHPALIPATNLSSQEIDRSELELVIGPQGGPASGHAEIRGRGRLTGQLQEIVIETNLTFTKVGTKVVVRAP